MGIKSRARKGFTLIELCIVIAILGVLASIAAVSYQRFRITEYDTEATATLYDLNGRASQLLSDWGISNADNDFQITKGCLGANPKAGAPFYGGTDGIAAEMSASDKWDKLNMRIEGTHHWRYNVCFGFLKSDGGAADVEGYLLGAVREVSGESRVVLFGSGITSPTIGTMGSIIIPKGAELNGVTTTNLFE